LFSVSQGSVGALIRWSGKILYISIADFFSNISAKYYDNATMLSQVIAKNIGDVETQCSMKHQLYYYIKWHANSQNVVNSIAVAQHGLTFKTIFLN